MPGSRSLLGRDPNRDQVLLHDHLLGMCKVTVSRDLNRQECIIFPRLYKHTYTHPHTDSYLHTLRL